MSKHDENDLCDCWQCSRMLEAVRACAREQRVHAGLKEQLQDLLATCAEEGVRSESLGPWIAEVWGDRHLADCLLAPSGERGGERKTWVYLMEALPSGLLKVGYSSNPASRRQSLRGGLLHDTDLVVLATVEGGRESEQELLGLLVEHGVELVNGKREWFHPHPCVFTAFGLTDRAEALK